MVDTAFLTTVGGLATGAFGAYWTVRTYFLKRQDELADRQRQALERAQAEIERQKAERQKELDVYAAGKTKEYAAKQDFNHLLRKYDALNANLTILHDFQEKRASDIEADLRTLMQMMQLLLVSAGQSETAVMRYLKREE
ncbi:MAG: hypothetical protein KME42_19710 [Tildeniella nuda ZEHNDER 1965/U140]|jgi:multidrug resistance efflux pump|nr:hypothetical protein [Tildeniella nuda ZEHNDER 1965/U140]